MRKTLDPIWNDAKGPPLAAEAVEFAKVTFQVPNVEPQMLNFPRGFEDDLLTPEKVGKPKVGKPVARVKRVSPIARNAETLNRVQIQCSIFLAVSLVEWNAGTQPLRAMSTDPDQQIRGSGAPSGSSSGCSGPSVRKIVTGEMPFFLTSPILFVC